MKILNRIFIMLAIGLSTGAFAGQVVIQKVLVSCSDNCHFSVTLKHADQGWQHYANLWEVLSLDGKVLGARTLAHPHVHEQPFTRTLSGVTIPQGVTRVKVRARDSKHGFNSKEFLVDIPSRN